MSTVNVPVAAHARCMPLLAVDSVESAAGGFVGYKKVRADEHYLRGHFPTLTVYPGVFIVESLQQMVELYLDGAIGGLELVELDSARFSRPVLDEDELRFETQVTGPRREVVTKSVVSVAGERCARVVATWRSIR